MKYYSRSISLIVTLLFFIFSSQIYSQVTVDYEQRIGKYDETFDDGGGAFNQGNYQMGMYANTGNKKTVRWRDFETDGANSGSARSLQVGDEFRISVSAHTVAGQMGFALLASPTNFGTWANRLENVSISLKLDSYGNWFATYYGGATTTGTADIGGTTSYKNFVFTCLLTAPNMMTVTITDGATTSYLYDLQLYSNSAITHYSVFLNDDWDGSSNNNIYWNTDATAHDDYVKNTKAITLGLSNNGSTVTISDVIPDGLAANSTSTPSVNSLTKSGSGTFYLTGNNTYDGGTTVSAGILCSGMNNASNTTFGSGSISVASGATLWIDGTNDGVYSNTLTLDGGTFLLTGTCYYDGNIILTSNSTLRSATEINYLDGIISGTSSVTKTGGYPLYFRAANTYSGSTTVSAGTLVIQENLSSSAVSVSNTATVSVNGSDVTISALTIDGGGTVSIEVDQGLTVTNNLTNNSSGNLRIQSDSDGTGSLIVNGTISGSGTNTFERYIAGYTTSSNGWHFLSSPVSSFTISGSDFAPSAGTDDLYRWDEPNNQWNNYDQSGFSEFAEGMGYLAAYDDDATKEFTGTPYNSDKTHTDLTYNSGNTYGAYHLLGNPFQSAVLWNNGDWAITDVNTTAKIWSGSGASYSDITANDPIPSMQGFIVYVANGTNSITIPESARSHNTQNWYKNSKVNQIKLTAYDPEGGTYQESTIRFDNDATSGFDNNHDSPFLSGYAPLFYSKAGQVDVSTNTLPEITESLTIPMYFTKNGNNSFYIEVEGVNTLLTEHNLYITDKKTNHTQNLNENPIYSFTSNENDDDQRFVLHFSPLGVDDNIINNDDIQVYSYSKTINITNGKKLSGSIHITNILGQQVASYNLDGSNNQSLNMDVPTGVYVVNVIVKSTKISKKVFIK
ncbi:MAG: T9SS type A sorting domain-containing protein [Lentimicrobiaceae bacterium]|nr:T9SS type A sorting domain-containing protein [Lentimicrobiaceae bacterium]